MLKSGIISITSSLTQIAICGMSEEVTVFGLQFSNTTAATRTVNLTLYRQDLAAAQVIPFELSAKQQTAFAKPIALQPGDYLSVSADATGVALLWSLDRDAGANPVASTFVIKGAWSNIVAYSALDIVYLGGSSYVAIRNNTNKSPDTQAADWMLLLDGSGTQNAIDVIVAGAPANLNTLNEIAIAIGNDPAFFTTVSTALSLKVDASSLASVAFTGAYSSLSGIKKLAGRRAFWNKDLF